MVKQNEWWKDYPWRLIQTNLRQIDMKDIDAEQYVRELRSFDATVVLFNASGIIANYETDLDFEPVNEYLSGDSTEKIILKCHEAGIRVMARTDFSKVRGAVYEKHPDWAFRKADGGIVNYNGDVHVCPNGPYQQEYMFRIISDMFGRLPFDGIFYNMGGFRTRDYSNNYHGLCHCANCERLFRERFGFSVPVKENPDDPEYRKHRVFQRECIRDLNARLTSHVRSIGPHIAIDNHDYQRIESNTEIGRPLPLWQYSASSNTRNSHQPGSDIQVSNTTVDFLGFSYRHVAVSPWLQELRLWQNIANRGNVDYYLIGRLDNHGDKSSFDNIRKVFKFAKENFNELKNLKSEAKAALFHGAHWDDDPEARGWTRVFCETHIPLDEIQLEFLCSPEQLKQYKLLVLPDLKYVSDHHASIIDEFARQGGTVLASGEAAFYDENYEKRNTMPLSCMGTGGLGSPRKDMLSAMLLIESDEDKKAFPHFEDSSYIALGHEFISTKSDPAGSGYTGPGEKTKSYLRLIPPQMFGPPERCYSAEEDDAARGKKSLPVSHPQYGARPAEAGLRVFAYGKGMGVYIPWKPGTFFYKEGYSNTAYFMRDVLEQLCGLESIAPELTPMVELTLSSRPGRFVVQLVNISGHYGNSYYEPLEIRDVHLKVPVGGKKVRGIRTLRNAPGIFPGPGYYPGSTEMFNYRPEGGYAHITLPLLREYEAIILETG